MEPNVPFVEGEIDSFLRVLLCLDGIADGCDRLDECVHMLGPCKIVGRLVRGVAVVLMHRNEVYVIVNVIENGKLPFTEGLHIVVRASASDELYRGVGPFHKLCRFGRYSAVVLSRLVTYLPGAVHLVSEAPGLYSEGLLEAVALSHICVVSIGIKIAVFKQVLSVRGRTRAEIYRHHNLCLCALCPLLKLVDAYLVRLNRFPSELKSFRALRSVTRAVHPVISRNEVSAGVSDDRNVYHFDKLHYVGAEAHIVSRSVRGLVNTAVNGSAEMLDERAVYSFVYLSYCEILIDRNLCFHFFLLNSRAL